MNYTIINNTDCEHGDELLKAHKKDIQIVPTTIQETHQFKQYWFIMNKYIQMAGYTNILTNQIIIEGYTLTINFYKQPEIYLS